MSYMDDAGYWAQRYNVDPDLFTALVRQESGFNPKARNPRTGAFGLTQVMPATAAQPGFGVAPLTDTDNSSEQLRFGAQYLSKMLGRYGGDTHKGLAAYNWGPGNADKWNGDLSALPAETRDYIAKILGQQGATPNAASSPPPEPDLAPEPEEPQYADNFLGRAAQGLDTSRDKVRMTLGLNEKGAGAIGSVLSQLGMQLMYG